MTVGFYLMVGATLHLFQGRAKVASLDEMLLLGTAIGAVGGLTFLLNLALLLVLEVFRRGRRCSRSSSPVGRVRLGDAWKNAPPSVNLLTSIRIES